MAKGRGKGGKIKNWNKAKNSQFWTHQEKDIKMAIGKNKTKKGYPITVFGNDTKNMRYYRPTKRKASTFAASWRRKLS